MDRVELAGAASLGGLLSWKRRRVLPVGTPCRNCETPLQGPFCHECGQLGEDFHRSIWKLAPEAVAEFFQVDGKFMKTLPALFLRPGKLTRGYIEGRRAFQIPPLRMFLVVLVIFFLAGEFGGSRPGGLIKVNAPPPTKAATKDNPGPSASFNWTDSKGRPFLRDSPLATWFQSHAERAAKSPDRFKATLGEWTHRFAVLMLPISALILSVLFAFKRGVYLFDHLIFSMHSLSFQGLLLSPMMLFGDAAAALLILAPIHLFFHMRGAYQTSILGALIRMALLGLASLIAFASLAVGLVVIGLNAVGG